MTNEEAIALLLGRLRAQVDHEVEAARTNFNQLANGLREIFGHLDLGRIAEQIRVYEEQRQIREMAYRDYLKQTIDIRRDALEQAAAEVAKLAKSRAEGEKLAAAVRSLHWNMGATT